MPDATRPAPAAPSARGDALVPLALLAAMVALLYTCRGAELGRAVADDYAFLAYRAFHRPFDWFDTMGAAYYWRPVGRQAWFTLLAPWLVNSAPAAAALHAVLLTAVAMVLQRILRRWFSPWTAAALATTPILTEAARVWLAWPSAAQHLLALLGATLAVHEALAGRAWTGALAGLLGALSHESAVLALPALPVACALDRRSVRAAIAPAIAATIAIALWAAGYAAARSHGVPLPAGHFTTSELASITSHVVMALANVEDVPEGLRTSLLGAHAVLLLAAALVFTRRESRRRLAKAWPALLACGALGLAAALPMARLLPDWNAWRASLAILALGLTVGGLLAVAQPWLAAAFVALRVVALLMAPIPAPAVGPLQPPSVSDLSFTRITRLQRVAREIRSELMRDRPTLRPGARIATWSFPTMVEVGLQSQLAARVWYRDSTLKWERFGGLAGYDVLPDVLLGMNPNFVDRPVVLVEPRCVELTRDAIRAFEAGQYVRSESLFVAAQDAQPRPLWEDRGSALLNRGLCRFQLRDYARAESLAIVAGQLSPGNGNVEALLALVALSYGRQDQAAQLTRAALAKSPNGQVVQAAVEALQQYGGGAR